MNRAKSALINFHGSPIHLNSALFHSSPILHRRRRTHWNSGAGGAYKDSPRRFNPYVKRFRRLHAKESLLRNVSAFADHLFQSWQYDRHEYDPSSSQAHSWSRQQEYGAKGPKGSGAKNKGTQSRCRRGFNFCEDDEDVETIFRSAFGGNGSFYWSFVNAENPQWRNSSNSSSNFRTWKWTSRNYEEEYYESSTEESGDFPRDLTSERLALGLSASGALKIEDVKHAYRACALKWHPDRHQGSSKVFAEEKFKVCSAAYQSLCDKLPLN